MYRKHSDTIKEWIGNVEKTGNIVYLPIYMSYLLKEKTIDTMIVDVDIIGL